MPNPTLTEQREAVEALIFLATQDNAQPHGTMVAAARQAVLTLAWLERKENLVRELVRLEREAPDVARALVEWPGLQIAGVR